MRRAVFSKLIIIISMVIFIFYAHIGAFALAPDNTTVEGNGNYFVTGESYPQSITFAGYNSRDSKLYLNFTLTTTKTVTGKIPTFNYYVYVFDGTSTSIGNLGTAAAPQTQAGTLGIADAVVSNSNLILSSPLTSEYRVVITVKSVSIP